MQARSAILAIALAQSILGIFPPKRVASANGLPEHALAGTLYSWDRGVNRTYVKLMASQPILYMRHGATLWNGEDRFQGTIDTHLCAEGIADARANGRIVRQLVNDDVLDAARLHIVTSPLARARESAGTIAASLDPRPTISEDPRLREISMGRWQGLTTWQVKDRFYEERRARKRDRYHFAAKGGESLAQREADVRFVTAVIRPHAIVFTHAGILRLLLHVLGGMDAKAAAGTAIGHVGGLLYHDGQMFQLGFASEGAEKIVWRAVIASSHSAPNV